jgi:hypothetical protein
MLGVWRLAGCLSEIAYGQGKLSVTKPIFAIIIDRSGLAMHYKDIPNLSQTAPVCGGSLLCKQPTTATYTSMKYYSQVHSKRKPYALAHNLSKTRCA